MKISMHLIVVCALASFTAFAMASEPLTVPATDSHDERGEGSGLLENAADAEKDLQGSETIGYGFYPGFYPAIYPSYGGYGGYGYRRRWGYGGYGSYSGYGGFGGYGGYYRRPIPLFG